MLRHFQNGGLICRKGTALWVMKAADWHCENDINVGIVFLATNRLSFTDRGTVYGPVCGEGTALWVLKAADSDNCSLMVDILNCFK